MLRELDEGRFVPSGGRYHFSENEVANGHPGFSIAELALPITQRPTPLGWDDSGSQVITYGDVRDGYRTSLRAAMLLTAQVYLEIHKVETVVKACAPASAEMFLFMRQARNIVCHSDGARMSGARLRRSVWRGHVIDTNHQVLKLSDANLQLLVHNVLDCMVALYVADGRSLDFVTMNLGWTVPAVHRIAREVQKNQKTG